MTPTASPELATATASAAVLLPEAPPAIAGWQLDAFIEACNEVGGDLYDFYTREDGKLVFLIGDVTGKGMGAALLMSSFLASARALYDAIPDPGELARRVGAMLYRSTRPQKFVTAIRLPRSFDGTSSRERGHPSRCGAAGAVREWKVGSPFGLLGISPMPSTTVLAPGRGLVLVHRRIPEAQRGEELYERSRPEAVVEESARPI